MLVPVEPILIPEVPEQLVELGEVRACDAEAVGEEDVVVTRAEAGV